MITGNIVMMGQGKDHMYRYQKIISAQVQCYRSLTCQDLLQRVIIILVSYNQYMIVKPFLYWYNILLVNLKLHLYHFAPAILILSIFCFLFSHGREKF